MSLMHLNNSTASCVCVYLPPLLTTAEGGCSSSIRGGAHGGDVRAASREGGHKGIVGAAGARLAAAHAAIAAAVEDGDTAGSEFLELGVDSGGVVNVHRVLVVACRVTVAVKETGGRRG